MHIYTPQIIRQYDIILIQEVRGVNLNPNVPMGLLQRVGNNDGNEYAICNEEYKFKGKTKYKEMYLFLYR